MRKCGNVKAALVRLNLSAFVSPPVLLLNTRSTSVSSASYGADPIGKLDSANIWKMRLMVQIMEY
ncbi:unnamed protein product [Brassica rapa]|uniref:Uncharacterized protein n=1 Tax=Brassica campestris TaxID=3711 RepID=A0A3P5ZQW5_BRACM|nr:unnamed protein product [Brassica rapa]VDC83086.1 unnamed protein product [Brassica rapa]